MIGSALVRKTTGVPSPTEGIFIGHQRFLEQGVCFPRVFFTTCKVELAKGYAKEMVSIESFTGTPLSLAWISDTNLRDKGGRFFAGIVIQLQQI